MQGKFHPKKVFTELYVPPVDYSYALLEGKKTNAPLFTEQKRGIFKSEFLLSQDWTPAIGQRIISVDPGQVFFLTCSTFTVDSAMQTKMSALRDITVNEDGSWGAVDIFALENIIREGGSRVENVSLATRQFFEDTLASAHKQRRNAHFIDWRKKKKVISHLFIPKNLSLLHFLLYFLSSRRDGYHLTFFVIPVGKAALRK